MSEVIARRLVVHGRVQGVFFRAETRQQARRRGVHGWVANRPDGTVEAWLEGRADAVDTVERWISSGGPRRASVDAVDAESVDPGDHDSFEVRG